MKNWLKRGCFLWLFILSGFVGAIPEKSLHYQVLPSSILNEPAMQAIIAEYPGQTPLIEFFSYGCHWCHDLEPSLQSWLNNNAKKVVLIRVPVIFHPTWRPLAKAYFTAQQLDQSARFDPVVFKAIHEDHKMVVSDEDVRTIFIQNGVNAKVFDEAYGSSSVNQRLKWIEEMTRLYQIKQVPTLVLVGKKGISLTTLQAVGGRDHLSTVLDEMLNQ